ncbi:hypothetical protein HN419_07680 [Candidatus Woesearchaeota archaeon]|jgi:hypothetical protein|nr:hypothetical protein [Candidatus Woesearchaeota archaeon]MBT3538371.1 hypothetical protein [Candidatus Woesearchaeota archaeon]MBT4698348.1 hypothetical protein [Candidatus Woesearchaeota archaeon]MBT4717169.1 hypothetical protein [Candidatus Woesearchaeota archaeon]MBT7106040.1 hypothetical protein [Candidatus Woesearchaeota archaeon]
MDNGTLLVSLGEGNNSLVHRDNWVTVRVGKIYVRKKAGDLRDGDWVVTDYERVDVDIDRAEKQVLENFLTYNQARDTVFEQNSAGLWLPRMRRYLIEGINGQQGLGLGDLEDRILKEDGADFSKQEYRAMVDAVNETGIQKGEYSIRNWLYGDVAAMKPWSDFAFLATINPIFQQIADSHGQETGYHADYVFWVGSRISVMKYLGRTPQTGKRTEGGKLRERPKGRSDYRGMREHAVERFAAEISHDHPIFQVTGVKRVSNGHKKPEGAAKGGRNGGPKLKRGIRVGAVDGIELSDLLPVANEHKFLENVLYDAIRNYAFEQSDQTENQGDRLLFIDCFDMYACTRLLHETRFEKALLVNNRTVCSPEYRSTLRGTHKVEERMNKRLARLYDKFESDLKAGIVDEANSLVPHTVASLIDVVNQLRRALPITYFDMRTAEVKYRILSSEVEDLKTARGRGVNGARKRARKEKFRERDRYHGHREVLEAEHEFRYVDIKRLFAAYDSEMRVGQEIAIDGLAEQKAVYERNGVSFFTRREARQILDKYYIDPAAVNILSEYTFI